MFRLISLGHTLIISLLFAFNSSAEIYRWVDENGNTQFSDKPVKGNTASTVNVDTSKNSYGGGAVLNRQRELLTQYQDQDLQSQKDKHQALLDSENKKKLAAACLQAKDKLANFQRSLIYTLDDQGERVYYSEEKREQRIESFRKTIDENC